MLQSLVEKLINKFTTMPEKTPVSDTQSVPQEKPKQYEMNSDLTKKLVDGLTQFIKTFESENGCVVKITPVTNIVDNKTNQFIESLAFTEKK